MSAETSNVAYTVDAKGYALVNGHRVLGNSANLHVRVSLDWDGMCQLCATSVRQAPKVLWHRYESALERDMYWFDINPETKTVKHCAACVVRMEES